MGNFYAIYTIQKKFKTINFERQATDIFDNWIELFLKTSQRNISITNQRKPIASINLNIWQANNRCGNTH